ncbi:YraN family protein [bacterium]|nr:YraN family protein [bacterium]
MAGLAPVSEVASNPAMNVGAMIGRVVERLGRRPGAFDPSWSAPQAGAWGEEWAAWHYFHRRGAAILSRNWHGGGGELDLVVREKETLVFVEVKLRDPKNPDPLAAVRDSLRKRHFRSAAMAYLRRLPKPHPPYRFDVLLVTPNPMDPRRPQLDCLEDVLQKSSEG